MNDYAHADRQALIADTPEFRREHKVRRAVERMGERYVFHPVNRVQRTAPPVQVSVARTMAAHVHRNALDLA